MPTRRSQLAPESSWSRGEYRHDFGVWLKVSAEQVDFRRPALFLDRDGVIVEEAHYLCRAEEVVMVSKAAETIATANRLHVPVVVVTNQAGIGRGYYDWDDFAKVDAVINRNLTSVGARIDAVLACPFHPEGIAPWRHPCHPARKPCPGMLLTAASLLNLDLARSWIIGDHSIDIQAGFNAGLRGAVHVLTGHGMRERATAVAERSAGFELRLAGSIGDAVSVIEMLARSR